MADGEARLQDDAIDTRSPGVIARLIAHRQTPFWTAFGFGIVGCATFIGSHLFGFLDLSASLLARLSLGLSFLLSMFSFVLVFRDTSENFAHGPKPILPSLSIATLIAATAFIVTYKADTAFAASMHAFAAPDEILIYCYVAFLIPLLIMALNAGLMSSFQEKARKEIEAKRASSDAAVDADREDAEAMGALLATLAIAALSLLATSAARWGEALQLQALYGVGLSAFVVGIFGIVIFLEPLSQMGFVAGLSRPLRWVSRRARFLASFYGALDEFLVRIGAVMVGMEHRSMWSRYSVLATTLACLSVCGWFLPPPHGLVPALIALILALAVSRLWSWVEDDRALAALTGFNRDAPYRTEMREDYRDETLLGFIFVFALMPIIMYQIHHSPAFEATDGIFNVPEDQQHSFIDWLGFFGIELAKAVPIVDWAEIYNIGKPGSDPIISMRGAYSQHAVFLARITVDLVLIAALLQAIGISNRNRQQKRLYNAGAMPNNRHHPGLIDRLDPFVERTELQRAILGTTRKNAPPFRTEIDGRFARNKVYDLFLLQRNDLIDFRRYNTERLQELYHGSSDPRLRSFIAALEADRPGFTLKTRIQLLETLAENNRDEAALYNVQAKLVEDYRYRPSETDISIDQLRTILLNTQERSGLREFKLKIIDLMRDVAIAGSVVDVESTIEFLVDIAGRSNPDAFQYTRAKAVVACADLVTQLKDERLLRVTQAQLIELRTMNPNRMTATAIRGALDRIDRCLQHVIRLSE